MKYCSIEEMRSLRSSGLFNIDKKEKRTGNTSFLRKLVFCFQNIF